MLSVVNVLTKGDTEIRKDPWYVYIYSLKFFFFESVIGHSLDLLIYRDERMTFEKIYIFITLLYLETFIQHLDNYSSIIITICLKTLILKQIY